MAHSAFIGRATPFLKSQVNAFRELEHRTELHLHRASIIGKAECTVQPRRLLTSEAPSARDAPTARPSPRKTIAKLQQYLHLGDPCSFGYLRGRLQVLSDA